MDSNNFDFLIRWKSFSSTHNRTHIYTRKLFSKLLAFRHPLLLPPPLSLCIYRFEKIILIYDSYSLAIHFEWFNGRNRIRICGFFLWLYTLSLSLSILPISLTHPLQAPFFLHLLLFCFCWFGSPSNNKTMSKNLLYSWWLHLKIEYQLTELRNKFKSYAFSVSFLMVCRYCFVFFFL